MIGKGFECNREEQIEKSITELPITPQKLYSPKASLQDLPLSIMPPISSINFISLLPFESSFFIFRTPEDVYMW